MVWIHNPLNFKEKPVLLRLSDPGDFIVAPVVKVRMPLDHEHLKGALDTYQAFSQRIDQQAVVTDVVVFLHGELK